MDKILIFAAVSILRSVETSNSSDLSFSKSMETTSEWTSTKISSIFNFLVPSKLGRNLNWSSLKLPLRMIGICSLLIYDNIIYLDMSSGKCRLHLGCWRDNLPRAISGRHTDFNENHIEQCHDRTIQQGYTVFGVQAGVQCFTAADAEETYKKHGISTNCKDGVGGIWALDVYKIVPCKPGVKMLARSAWGKSNLQSWSQVILESPIRFRISQFWGRRLTELKFRKISLDYWFHFINHDITIQYRQGYAVNAWAAGKMTSCVPSMEALVSLEILWWRIALHLLSWRATRSLRWRMETNASLLLMQSWRIKPMVQLLTARTV